MMPAPLGPDDGDDATAHFAADDGGDRSESVGDAGEKAERSPAGPVAGSSWTEPRQRRSSLTNGGASGGRAGASKAVSITEDQSAQPGSARRGLRQASVRRGGSRAGSSVGGPVSERGASDEDDGSERTDADFFDESAVLHDVGVLQSELQAVLDSVERVQSSWAIVEKDRPKHGLVMMRRFFEVAPQALPLFSFGREAREDPSWDLSKDKRVASHAIIIISTVGAVVAGLKDFQSMTQTLRKVGTMHHRHKGAREFFTPMGDALLFALQEALGPAFTPDVGQGARGPRARRFFGRPRRPPPRNCA